MFLGQCRRDGVAVTTPYAEGVIVEQPVIAAGAEEPAAKPSIRLTNAGKLNLADFQNSVPLLRELVIVNESDSGLEHLQLRLESFPPFLKPRTWTIDGCPARTHYSIKDNDVSLDGVLLGKLTEAETATLVVTLVGCLAKEPERELCREERKVELLPRNQWGGLSHLPDMVAAFVQPNELAVDRLLKQLAEVLRAAGKNPAIDGYAGGPKRAWELTSALWSAVASLGIDYALPPASFEHRGQKVRGPAQVLDARLGTCMDLTLLFCAALEQAGLNPVIVFTKGHAFAGVWLRAEEFSSVVVDDVTAIRKRVKLKELVLFETTLITHRPTPSFTYATENAASKVSEEHEEEFELVVDIRRARMQRIKPLASAESQIAKPPEEVAEIRPPVFDEAPDLPEGELAEPDAGTLDPKDRLARWQRKLLDLSLRNNLLNFKTGKKALRLDAPDPGALEDLLSDGGALKLLPKPDLMDGQDPRDQAIHEKRSREDVRRQHALEALARREVFVSVSEDELETRLVELFRTARTTLQEGGANTLFLALGFLSWNRQDKTDVKYKAPLILIPVSLHRKSARSGFTVVLHEDEPRFNPTLIEMLRQDFGLQLGALEGELPRDEAGLDVDRIWKTVSYAVKDIKGWEVSEEVVLAMFSFAKYLMWVDLTQRTDQLRENPVVKHLIDTPRDPYPSSVAFPEPKRLDAEFGPDKTFCPLPSDSSQLSAVMAAVKGKDFVLIGPPGTGKSQTISNLIAQCLAEGKRVLFVSEKIAALDVVYRRLREVGLGEFCLELHSSKARKLDVLAQLQKAWEAQGEVDPEQWRIEADRLKRYRDELNQYVERMHLRRRNGLNIYNAIGVVVDGEDVPMLELSWSSPDAHDAQQLASLKEVVARLAINADAVGAAHLVNGPLNHVGRSEWTPTWQQAFLQSARAVVPVAEHVEQAAADYIAAAGLPRVKTTRRIRTALASLARALPAARGRDWGFAFRPDARTLLTRMNDGLKVLKEHRAINEQLAPPWSDAVLAQCKKGLSLLADRKRVFAELAQPWPLDVVEELSKGLRLLEKASEGHKRLSVQYGDQVEQLNVHQLQRDWAKAEKAVWPISWFGKRAVSKVMDGAMTGEGKADFANDLKVLVKIRELKSEVCKLEIGPATEGVWAGLKTRPEFAHAALKFQLALAAIHKHESWTDDGFDALASGRCGPRLAAELSRARQLRSLDQEIASLADLASATDGLWTGHSTQAEKLEAAMRFAVASRDVQDSGPLQGQHDEVAASDCGAALAANYLRLRKRSEVEHRLQAFDDLRMTTGGTWAGLQTKQDDVERVGKFHASVTSAVAALADGPDVAAATVASLQRLVVDGNALLDEAGTVTAAGARYLESLGGLQPALDKLAELGEFTDLSTSVVNDLGLDELISRCKETVSAESRLHAWCAWRKVRGEVISSGLAALVAAVESVAVQPAAVERTFTTNYCRWWLNAVVDNEPVVRSFVSAEHEKRIGDFRALDKRFTELTRAWVRASLCADLPKADTVSRNSEWGILRHEMSKKKQHLPLRELMTKIPSALVKLTPCLLMSPLSIAQYLSADASAFDLVVFDEASQIPVWDAIGAIARGKQVVMVGDPKQLPPTAFFDRAESSLDDEDVETDLESILDECMGANLPTMNLAWHYRSRNESLIAFSNHKYYGGGLVTFPSPVTEDRAVSFHHVNGVYEKGGARINKAEAKALVADVVARLKSPGFAESKLTIGIVTFNTEQMNLIEDLLDEERRKDPSLEPHFSEMELEPLFVKNLESVQGDERDIMYFSITFGPDLSGAISMNFGPMNRDGGERRLNVAITRARHELRVFSSLRAEQFDLSRTQALGVRDLKHFLEFAERGPRALAEATKGSLGGFESPFEEAVAAALATEGWEVHTQIGASSFRVDLAVVHPDARGTYLCGVECDGATYHRSATARDRDMLREQVLRGLGWEIQRVWSTDWWIDRAGTFEKLHQALNDLLERSRATRAKQRELDEAKRQAEEAIARAREVAGAPAGPSDATAPKTTSTSSKVVEESRVETEEDAPERIYAKNEATPSGAPFHGFVEADPRQAVEILNADLFFDRSYDESLRRMVEHVAHVEGPVLDTVLARRIARAHGWQRTGARIQERVTAVATKVLTATEEDVGTFFWHGSRGPDEPVHFRSGGEESRGVDEVCLAELASLARAVVGDGKSGDAAVAAMAHALGLRHVRAANRNRLEKAMDLARSVSSGGSAASASSH
jgi:very-short-patch-repair endonuclease